VSCEYSDVMKHANSPAMHVQNWRIGRQEQDIHVSWLWTNTCSSEIK
jgi:hypothetical protein